MMKPVLPLSRILAFLLVITISALVAHGVEEAVKKTEKTAAKEPAQKKKGGRRAPALEPAPNFQVLIPKQAFGKEYLLSASMIPQAQAATGTGLAGKIVKFELFHDGVDMYESVDGLVVTKELPAKRLITTFPIVETQEDGGVVIDFNAGMDRIVNDIWYATSSRFSSRMLDNVVEVTSSRVFSVKKEGQMLSIRQAAQARDRQFNQNLESRYEVRYFIAPYRKSKFEAKENTTKDSRYLRFFETQPRLEDTTGRASSKIARFDITKPITFYYSANTPEDYVEAVKDGIIYWNRAFGQEVIKARKAPGKVTAPDASHNVIQWVPWDNAGFAYADILVDPRTGQSQRGQAFMTSVFAISGKARARRMLRAMQALADAEGKKEGDEKLEVDHDHGHEHEEGLFTTSSVCQVNRAEFARQFAAGLEELLANDELTDEAVLRASQDYVREVVAHEVGHVLGLRHNFAGNLEATLSHKELDDWFKGYLAGEDLSKYKDKLTSSSMMEYTVFKGGAFIGWKMRTTNEALPHDKAAIQWGYFDESTAREKKMLYATDGDDRIWGDVTTFDYGTEQIIGGYSEIADIINGLPNKLIEEFIEAKAPKDPRDVIPLEAVNLSPSSFAFPVYSEYNRILKWFRASTRSVKIEKQFAFVGPLNEEERIKAHWKSLNDQFERLGGVDPVLFGYLPTPLKVGGLKKQDGQAEAPKLDAGKLKERVAKLLEADPYKNFVGLDEKEHSFTDDEKKIIVERAGKLFAEVEPLLLRMVMDSLGRSSRDIGLKAEGYIGESDLISKFEERIINLAEYVITAKGSDKIEGKLNKSHVTITDYKFDMDVRMSAARALTDSIGSFDGWAKKAKGDIHNKVKGEIESMLNSGNLKSFSDSMLSRPLREWYLKQQSLLKLLPPMRSSTPPPSSSSAKKMAAEDKE